MHYVCFFVSFFFALLGLPPPSLSPCSTDLSYESALVNVGIPKNFSVFPRIPGTGVCLSPSFLMGDSLFSPPFVILHRASSFFFPFSSTENLEVSLNSENPFPPLLLESPGTFPPLFGYRSWRFPNRDLLPLHTPPLPYARPRFSMAHSSLHLLCNADAFQNATCKPPDPILAQSQSFLSSTSCPVGFFRSVHIWPFPPSSQTTTGSSFMRGS